MCTMNWTLNWKPKLLQHSRKWNCFLMQLHGFVICSMKLQNCLTHTASVRIHEWRVSREARRRPLPFTLRYCFFHNRTRLLCPCSTLYISEGMRSCWSDVDERKAAGRGVVAAVRGMCSGIAGMRVKAVIGEDEGWMIKKRWNRQGCAAEGKQDWCICDRCYGWYVKDAEGLKRGGKWWVPSYRAQVSTEGMSGALHLNCKLVRAAINNYFSNSLFLWLIYCSTAKQLTAFVLF